jgi:outer membrane protein
MPEIATVQADLQKVEADYLDHIESISVERNKKMEELSNLPAETSETTRQLKNRELVELSQRLEEYYQVAQQGVQQAQNDLMTPLQDKALAAVEKICKAQGIMAVFQIGSMVYLDEAQTTDITAAVKAELGIPADAVPAGMAPAQ